MVQLQVRNEARVGIELDAHVTNFETGGQRWHIAR